MTSQCMIYVNMSTCCCRCTDRYRQDAWDLTAADDGQITLDEWYSFIDYLGDKNKVSHSAVTFLVSVTQSLVRRFNSHLLCCVMCVTQEHAHHGLEIFEKYMNADPKLNNKGRRTGAFWTRCNAAFDAVDSGTVRSTLHPDGKRQWLCECVILIVGE